MIENQLPEWLKRDALSGMEAPASFSTVHAYLRKELLDKNVSKPFFSIGAEKPLISYFDYQHPGDPFPAGMFSHKEDEIARWYENYHSKGAFGKVLFRFFYPSQYRVLKHWNTYFLAKMYRSAFSGNHMMGVYARKCPRVKGNGTISTFIKRLRSDATSVLIQDMADSQDEQPDISELIASFKPKFEAFFKGLDQKFENLEASYDIAAFQEDYESYIRLKKECLGAVNFFSVNSDRLTIELDKNFTSSIYMKKPSELNPKVWFDYAYRGVFREDGTPAVVTNSSVAQGQFLRRLTDEIFLEKEELLFRYARTVQPGFLNRKQEALEGAQNLLDLSAILADMREEALPSAFFLDPGANVEFEALTQKVVDRCHFLLAEIEHNTFDDLRVLFDEVNAFYEAFYPIFSDAGTTPPHFLGRQQNQLLINMNSLKVDKLKRLIQSVTDVQTLLELKNLLDEMEEGILSFSSQCWNAVRYEQKCLAKNVFSKIEALSQDNDLNKKDVDLEAFANSLCRFSAGASNECLEPLNIDQCLVYLGGDLENKDFVDVSFFAGGKAMFDESEGRKDLSFS